MIIRNGIIFIWSGTNASIPARWSRVTAMDSVFPKGTADGVNPNVTGGAATHSHSATATHTHAINAHTHTVSIGTGAGGVASTGDGSSAASLAHNHAGFTSGAVASDSVSTVASTYSALSNNPPFHDVIYITPTSTATSIPTGIIALADAAATGFDVCDGTNSTPNLVDKYLKGTATGADAGTTGGSVTNVHTLTHSHTTSHAHGAGTAGGSTGTAGSSGAGSTIAIAGHTHSVPIAAATPSLTVEPALTTTETVEPAYVKIMAVKRNSNSVYDKRIIALWLGTLANIPTGWVLCDGTGGTVDMRGKHLKITATPAHIGSTGGSNTHTHASQAHSHTVSHTHASTIDHAGVLSRSDTTGSANTATSAITHAISTDAVNIVTGNGSTAADASNNEPSYRTVAYIKLTGETGSWSPSFFANFVNWRAQ